MTTFEPRTFTILVVEDNNLSRKSLIGMLFKSGYENILSAADGQSAIEKIAQSHIDLVITDINMPHINGLELIKAIRMGNTKTPPETSIIAVTALSDTKTISTCMRFEIDAFLSKPIKVKDTREQIEQAITAHSELYQQHQYHDVVTDINRESSNATTPHATTNSNQFITLASLAELQAGMTLAGDIFANNGGCLLKAGTLLDSRLVNRLKELSLIIDKHPIRVQLEDMQPEGV
ncbi:MULTISPECIES: response regulator [Vibrio]|uniref:response regulator n=1 Tax=Vibrio TaxID=662 RepID=UPI002075F001|nr:MULTISPECIES: response regulator [Vibrio]USD35204.1 response regulator [Vibrio sp. SCSIO 43186]USD48270.1 response regulator [Vibrio sp. SCSIO 43145]USD72329.1 response regulator [Vibrio sp. SCSIO 43139]USD98005.1 response regulator [Vibrio coralliilyticus]